MQTISSLRLLRLLSAVAGLVLCALSTAEARHAVHHGHFHLRGIHDEDRAHEDQVARPQPSNSALPSSHTSEFATGIAQVIRDCKEQAVELQNTPTNMVIEAVKPNKDQLAAIERVRSATVEAAKKLNASCPNEVPTGLSESITMADQALGVTKAALVLLRPALGSAYASLNDEQKAQLVVSEFSNKQQIDSASTDSSAFGKDGAGAHAPFDCRQWPSLLKDWQLNKIEVDPSLSDEERAELYELMAAVYRTTGHLAASCQADDALTPVARLDSEVNRIDMLRQCFDGIAPALDKFTNSLNDEQKARFNTAVGITAQAKTRSDTGEKE